MPPRRVTAASHISAGEFLLLALAPTVVAVDAPTKAPALPRPPPRRFLASVRERLDDEMARDGYVLLVKAPNPHTPRRL